MHTAVPVYVRRCSSMHVQQHVDQQASRHSCLLQIGSVATAAGVGGGAFFVPLFNILLNFSEHSTSCSLHQLHALSLSFKCPHQQSFQVCIAAQGSRMMPRSMAEALSYMQA